MLGHLAAGLCSVADIITSLRSEAASLRGGKPSGAPPIAEWLVGEDAAQSAADDFEALLIASKLRFDAAPASWGEAAERLRRVVAVARREQGGGARPELTEEQRKLEKGAYAYLSRATATSKAAAKSSILVPAAEAKYVRAETTATKDTNPLLEVRRLVDMSGNLGQANWATIFSDGSVDGATPPSQGGCRTRGRA